MKNSKFNLIFHFINWVSLVPCHEKRYTFQLPVTRYPIINHELSSYAAIFIFFLWLSARISVVSRGAFWELAFCSHAFLWRHSNGQTHRQTRMYVHGCFLSPTLSHSYTVPFSRWTPSWMLMIVSNPNYFLWVQIRFLTSYSLLRCCLTTVLIYFLSIFPIIQPVLPAYLGCAPPSAISPPWNFDILCLSYSNVYIIMQPFPYSFNKLSSRQCASCCENRNEKKIPNASYSERKLLIGGHFCHYI